MKVLRKQEIETANIQVGDQVIIPLAEIGEFSATAHKVTDEGIMFIFDEYITRRPMNSKNTNKTVHIKPIIRGYCLYHSKRSKGEKI